ncbi:MAG: hypothetical protein L6433_02965 [Actinomycetia bacterium]|nr:hypothetical protein [Actinomycetes bacterium]
MKRPNKSRLFSLVSTVLIAAWALTLCLASPAVAETWNIKTVDSAGRVGSYTSLALDSSGNPRISYLDDTNWDLKYAYSNDGGVTWPAANIKTVDSAGNVGSDTSLALDSSGNPRISYFDNTNGDLKFAYSNDGGATWPAANIKTVDSAGNVGLSNSLALDSSGNPRIGYLDWDNGDLKFAYSNDFVVVAPTLETNAATNVTTSGATLNGNITDTGDENCDERGFQYREEGGTWTDWDEAGSFGTGSYSHGISGLTPGATYEFKARAHNSAGWGSGGTLNFTTDTLAPTVTSITPGSADNDGTVPITNLAGTNFRNGATVQLIGPSGSGVNGAGTINATNVKVVSSTKITCDFGVDGAAAGSYTVKVANDDGKSGSKAGAFTVTEAPSESATWYLAEGTTAWGYSCYISIENPNNTAVSATVTYMTDTGAVPGGDIDLPANSQATVNPVSIVREKDFSTMVECKEGKTIAVDRTMSWTGEGAPSPDGHCSIGVTGADTTWYLAEGSSAWGFDCWLLIQNPNATEATAQVTYMIEGADPVTVEKKIPGNQRKTYNMANDIGEKDASIKVEADIPVIPERAMYRNNKRSGHDSIGTTAPAADYYLAEGTTNYGFTTYVLVQNPNNTATDVNVTYLTSSGAVPQAPFNMPGNSRKTIRVNDVLPASDFSTQVSGSQPVIAERAMYWGENTELGEAAHDSIGLSAPHTTFYLPDGETSNGRETYTLVMNPNDTAVEVEISYLTPDGEGNVIFTETVGANSRMTYSMIDKGISGRAAVLVTCKTSGKKIMVERAMYWNNRGAGTDTIGGFSD